jgi:hypothetical protein
MGIHIGGAGSWKQRTLGDIVLSLQWVNGEPAMLIWPKVKRLATKGAYAICLSSAYKYTDMKYLIQQAGICAEFIGMDKTGFTVRRIADAILDNLQDLCEMPPEQMVKTKEPEKAIGDMVLKLNGDVILEKEMTEAAQ